MKLKKPKIAVLIFYKKQLVQNLDLAPSILKKIYYFCSHQNQTFLNLLMKIIIINGPNLNLLGIREKSIYGDQSFENYYNSLKQMFPEHQIEYFQSNTEGFIIDKLHEVGFDYEGIVLNAGAYTHTSVAISDAIAAIKAPVIEVHISNVYARESFRHHSYLSKNCKGVMAGFGLEGYKLAITYLINTAL